MNEDNAGGKFDQVSGKIKEGIGEAFGNEKLANEGAAEQVKGHAKEAWGNVKDAANDTRTDSRSTTSAHVSGTEAHTGNNVRDSITSAAEHAKDSINRGIDHLKGDDHRL